MSKIKTYGEIQYYLYDGDKKERKVSRQQFYNSKDASSNNKKCKKTTGKIIENFENFINEFNGPNLALDYNTNLDFKTYQGKQFDGGDGNTGTEVPRTFKHTVNNPILQKGNNANKKQKEREKKRKELSKEYRIAKLMDYQTDDDLITNSPRMQPTINA